jgi:hypothetical protein
MLPLLYKLFAPPIAPREEKGAEPPYRAAAGAEAGLEQG